MITLFGSGPNFGLPDASPFVTKAETLLRMSKLPFEKALMSFSKAPKGKIPYIDDDGEMLGELCHIFAPPAAVSAQSRHEQQGRPVACFS